MVLIVVNAPRLPWALCTATAPSPGVSDNHQQCVFCITGSSASPAKLCSRGSKMKHVVCCWEMPEGFHTSRKNGVLTRNHFLWSRGHSYFMSQVGAIREISHARPILLQTIGNVAASLVAWVCFGYALASGEDTGGFVGKSFFFFAGKNSVSRLHMLRHFALTASLPITSSRTTSRLFYVPSRTTPSHGRHSEHSPDRFSELAISDDPFADTPERSTAGAFLGCLYQWSFAAACTAIMLGRHE